MGDKMKFTETDGAWFSGRYKCVNYGGKWFAYFKPFGWKNWGNSCQKTARMESVQYATLAEAQAACRTHFSRYGERPKAIDRI
jgi:hypothetical protein